MEPSPVDLNGLVAGPRAGEKQARRPMSPWTLCKAHFLTGWLAASRLFILEYAVLAIL